MKLHQIELLPCPFCGGAPHKQDSSSRPGDRDVRAGFMGEHDDAEVSCQPCGLSMSAHFDEDLARRWNTRGGSRPVFLTMIPVPAKRPPTT